MARCVHLVRDELAFFPVAQVARQALVGPLDRIAEIGHAGLHALRARKRLPPAIFMPVHVGPIRRRAVAGFAAHTALLQPGGLFRRVLPGTARQAVAIQAAGVGLRVDAQKPPDLLACGIRFAEDLIGHGMLVVVLPRLVFVEFVILHAIHVRAVGRRDVAERARLDSFVFVLWPCGAGRFLPGHDRRFGFVADNRLGPSAAANERDDAHTNISQRVSQDHGRFSFQRCVDGKRSRSSFIAALNLAGSKSRGLFQRAGTSVGEETGPLENSSVLRTANSAGRRPGSLP